MVERLGRAVLAPRRPPLQDTGSASAGADDQGWTLLDARDWPAAERLFRARLASGSDRASDHRGLGRALMGHGAAFWGRYADAELALTRALEIAPLSVDIATELAGVRWHLGWYEAACTAVVDFSPSADRWDTWHYLAMALLGVDDPGAEAALREARQRLPNIPDRLWGEERYAEALPYFELPDACDDRTTHLRRFEAMVWCGRLDDAEPLARSLAPFGNGEERYRDVADMVGILHGRPVAAVSAADQAYLLGALDLRGILCAQQLAEVGRLPALLLAVIRGEQPAHAVLAWVGQRYCWMGEHDAAMACYRAYAPRAVPGDRATMPWLTSILAAESTTRANVLERVREANRFVFPNGDRPNRFPPPRPLDGRRIRVGYNCCYLDNGTSRANFGDIFAAHDRKTFEIIVFNTGAASEAMRTFYSALVDRWIECGHLTDDELEKAVIGAKLDVLNDFDGVGTHRGPVLARKLAPVQVNLANWSMTTGLAAYDYFIGRPLVTEPADDPTMSERIKPMLRINPCTVPGAPPTGTPPALHRGYVTFGCFGAAHKVTHRSLDLWAEILRRVPGSHLMLKSRLAATREGRAYYHDQFSRRSVSPERLVLDGFTDYEISRQCYADIDISLDTFPHSGGASSWDPLWQGVPLVTLGADRFCSRWGTQYVSSFGHPEWAVTAEAEYIAVAVELARDIRRLADWRGRLRDQLDGLSWSAWVQDLERIYREIVAEAAARGATVA
jgi:hypothetical protein